MIYLTLKAIHILSAIILFGLGLGTVFYKIMADKTGNLDVIALTSKHVVQADWYFTTPTVLIQPVTGILMANIISIPLSTDWLVQAVVLYLLAGICWLPVLVLQIRMRDIALEALKDKTELPEKYHRYAKLWLFLGVPAFFAMITITVMMVFHASLWG